AQQRVWPLRVHEPNAGTAPDRSVKEREGPGKRQNADDWPQLPQFLDLIGTAASMVRGESSASHRAYSVSRSPATVSARSSLAAIAPCDVPRDACRACGSRIRSYAATGS